MPKAKNKEFRCTMTINVFANAKNKEKAERFFQDMGITFTHPVTGNEIENDLIDWEIEEI